MGPVFTWTTLFPDSLISVEMAPCLQIMVFVSLHQDLTPVSVHFDCNLWFRLLMCQRNLISLHIPCEFIPIQKHYKKSVNKYERKCLNWAILRFFWMFLPVIYEVGTSSLLFLQEKCLVWQHINWCDIAHWCNYFSVCLLCSWLLRPLPYLDFEFNPGTEETD